MNPLDTELFGEQREIDATFTAFGMTRRPGRSASNDPGLVTLLDAHADAICFVAKSWDYHVRVALETTLEENLAALRDSIRAGKAKGREVLIDCEHFFDGYKANPDYALACAKTAFAEGARWIVLCDTNGGTLPHEVERIVGEVARHVPGDHLGIHAHNDTEQAVANSLAAVRAGARQIQGTLNGLGERCGNANLVSIIPTLRLKTEFADRFDIGVSDDKLKSLSTVSRKLDEMLNRAPTGTRPMWATARSPPRPASTPPPSSRIPPPTSMCSRTESATAADCWSPTRAGVEPLGGARSRRPCGRQGRSAPRPPARCGEGTRGDRLCLRVGARLVRAAGAPHARRGAGYFTVEKFDVTVEHRINAVGKPITVSLAVVKVKVGAETMISAAEGDGPVHALDLALRKDLGTYQKYIMGLDLTDYRVRILNGGSKAVTRVLIESRDEAGESWTTVGVSANIIEASFQALMDSIVYKLVRSGATA